MATKKVYLMHQHPGKYVEAFYVRAVGEDGKLLKSKSYSVSKKRDQKQAYKLATTAVEDLAKIHNITETSVPSFESFISKLREANLATPASDGDKTKIKPSSIKKSASKLEIAESEIGTAGHQLVERFGNHERFKALMRQVVKLYGADKADEILKGGLEIIEEAKAKLENERAVITEAHYNIARAIKAARDKGVNMSAEPEIEEIIKRLYNQSIPTKDASSYIGNFKLPDSGEHFYGDGTNRLPATFVKYLTSHPDKSIDDLRVAS